MITVINEAEVRVISLDAPSGLNGDSGTAPGAVVLADECLTLAQTRSQIHPPGYLWLGDLGIPVSVYRRLGIEPCADL